jgi:hypothetical protein
VYDDRIRQHEQEREDKRWRVLVEWKRDELARQRRMDEARLQEDRSLVSRTRKFADDIKHVFLIVPTENAELPAFFDSVENLIKLFEIPADLKSKLLLPRPSGTAMAIVNRLSLDKTDDYEAIKMHLLNEFRLTSRELRASFSQAVKRSEESYASFASRLGNLLTYYLRIWDAQRASSCEQCAKMFDSFVHM